MSRLRGLFSLEGHQEQLLLAAARVDLVRKRTLEFSSYLDGLEK